MQKRAFFKIVERRTLLVGAAVSCMSLLAISCAGSAETSDARVAAGGANEAEEVQAPVSPGDYTSELSIEWLESLDSASVLVDNSYRSDEIVEMAVSEGKVLTGRVVAPAKLEIRPVDRVDIESLGTVPEGTKDKEGNAAVVAIPEAYYLELQLEVEDGRGSTKMVVLSNSIGPGEEGDARLAAAVELAPPVGSELLVAAIDINDARTIGGIGLVVATQNDGLAFGGEFAGDRTIASGTKSFEDLLAKILNSL